MSLTLVTTWDSIKLHKKKKKSVGYFTFIFDIWYCFVDL